MQGLSMGSLLGAGFGFIIGGFPMMGIFGWLGSILFPEVPDAPELDDLGQNSYVRDMPVPVCYGYCKVYGGVIWIGTNYVEMVNEGSKKNPNYGARYYAQFAVAMSEGPIADYGDYFINDNSVADALEDDKIELSVSEYLGTADQGLNYYVEQFLGGEPASGVPWRNTAYLVCAGSLGQANSLPTFAALVMGRCMPPMDPPGNIDANPIAVVFDILTNGRYGMGINTDYIDGHPDVADSGSFRTEFEYCNELVLCSDGSSQQTRFGYSNVITERTKGYDLIQDVLTTCRGMIFIDGGKIKVKIAKPDETPILFFADLHSEEYTVNVNSSGIRIYADFSGVPEGYWLGDLGLTTIGGSYFFLVITAQTATYIDIADTLPGTLLVGETFTIEKQNISKGTFKYTRKANRDTYNRMRVEYINRDDEWRTDVVEIDDGFDIEFTGEIRENTVQANGIKRAEQASRLAAFLLDFQTYTKYSCEFETDYVGYILSLGDIISVSSIVANWNCKLFRVMGKEEGENFDVKLSLLEYNSGCYHDFWTTYSSINGAYSVKNPYSTPAAIERFNLIEDTTTNKIYFTFKRPDGESYWYCANFYKYNNGSWDYDCQGMLPTPSVKLISALNSTDTTIYYDPDTMYGSFPASGSFWIDTEEISYTSINDTTDCFEGCTRGYNDTTVASHADTAYCILRQAGTPYYEYTKNEIGQTLTFRGISVNTVGMLGDSGVAPSDSIVIEGYSFIPGSVSSLQLNDQGNVTTLVASDDAILSWRLVTGGINKGYGYCYGYYAGYGDGTLEDFYRIVVEVYKTSTGDLIRSEMLDGGYGTEPYGDDAYGTDLEITTYNYDAATNVADNGSYEDDLTFKVYQVSTDFLYSLPSILITNS